MFQFRKILHPSVFILTFVFISCSGVRELTIEESFVIQKNYLEENLSRVIVNNNLPVRTKIQSVLADHSAKIIEINFSRDISFIPMREENIDQIRSEIKKLLRKDFSNYNLKLKTMSYELQELIPNYYRDKIQKDSLRLPVSSLKNRIPVVKNLSKQYSAEYGLQNSNVLLWYSHGWYYNNTQKRWMWQRPRLFQTIEDLLPASFTIPYLIPMLENAGANVFTPRERDTQINECIVDNDFSSTENYREFTTGTEKWQATSAAGYGFNNQSLKAGENPFAMGTSRFISSSETETATAQWLPDIPENGRYAVYISFPMSENNVIDAQYEVYHTGGITKFSVNQTMGGNTWIYLGSFNFNKGRFDDQGVILSNKSSEPDKNVSADAVRFGGGMGVVEREGQISKRPKFMEGARYWLQFAGMPDTLIYNLSNNEDDYKDDYQSRAEYGNYLFGYPFGPNNNRNETGLKIPIDVSLAWHTDAGITRNDSVIGTLMIYSIPDFDSSNVFPDRDSMSRLANRDLSDIVQTQIVSDLRFKYDSVWTRRALMNAGYSEAVRPNFPSMLLELLAHQNFFDMKFALDPIFRFDASRAIYKGILKFLSVQYGFKYIVQPLPVKSFSAELSGNSSIRLKWKDQLDETEPTAVPENFIIYTRRNNGGFDNGILVADNEYLFENLEKGIIYSFKVSAVNTGGESFPSEILSVCWMGENSDHALVINGFDRVAPPSVIELPEFSGFTDFIDEGVPDKYDFSYSGSQYNFNPNSKWETDDKPGHGASSSNHETEIIAGNTFDFTYIHGLALMQNGLSFSSAGRDAITDGDINLTDYIFIDLILGEQKKTPGQKYRQQYKFEVFPPLLKALIGEYLGNGGKLFLSGSYIASDPYNEMDSSSLHFTESILKYKLDSEYASKTGTVFSINDEFLPNDLMMYFNTVFTDSIYKAEAPNAISGINGGKVLMRYAENNFNAVTGYNGQYGVIAAGFPFETILYEKLRTAFMKSVLKYLKIN